MIVVPLGAHVGVFSVLPRLRSMVLTSLPALSCQSPLPRSKRLAFLPWAASVPGAESKKTQVYHVYPTLRKPNSCCANVHCLGVFFLCLPSSSYRVWRFLCLFAIDVVVLRFSVVTLIHWRGVSLESINKPINLTCYFLFECSVEPPPRR